MGEIYQVIFNSQGSNVINNTNLNAVQYNVNWDAFLPKQYKKFKCQFIFKSIKIAQATSDFGFVNIDIGKVNIFDGLSMSSNLGIIQPQYFTSTNTYYSATSADNCEIYIYYPINRVPIITLKTYAGVNIANMTHYTLILNLEGIDE